GQTVPDSLDKLTKDQSNRTMVDGRLGYEFLQNDRIGNRLHNQNLIEFILKVGQHPMNMTNLRTRCQSFEEEDLPDVNLVVTIVICPTVQFDILLTQLGQVDFGHQDEKDFLHLI